MSSSVKLVFGGGGFTSERYPTQEAMREVLDILQAHAVDTIDTAEIYGESEESLGKVHAASRFTVDTKYPGGFSPVPSSKETVIASGETSLKKLQADNVDVYYVHAPDRRAPVEDLLAGINALYEAGKFKRFGLSNFRADEVEEVIRIAREKGYVLPTVYQGNYSAVARRAESEIMPVLRKNNISFYAYSPIAGGFLTKSVEQLQRGGEGRWDRGQMYSTMYVKPDILRGLQLWEEISKESRIPKVELAYRWVTYHSALKGELGDRVIFGARNPTQLKETLAAVKKGPLPSEILERIAEVWKIVQAQAPLDNFNDFAALAQK